MSTRFLLYGATGYTGQLIARAAITRGLRPILAGRDAARLEQAAGSLGAEYRVCTLDNPAALDAALADAGVLLNCAGPFRRTSAPLVDACLRTHTHYLDLAGEVPEFEALAARDAAARSAGVMLMPGVGFGVVPTDCMAAHLAARLPSASRLALAFQTLGGVSQGTAQTLFPDLMQPGVVRRDGVLAPARPAERRLRVDFGAGPTSVALNPWRGDLTTAFYTTSIPSIETYTAFPAPIPALMSASRQLGRLWNTDSFQRLLGALIRRLPAGPDEKALERGETHIWGEARDGSGRVAVARLHGPEAYRFTGLTAAALAEQALGGRARAGFQTPARVYGADFVLGLQGVSREDIV